MACHAKYAVGASTSYRLADSSTSSYLLQPQLQQPWPTSLAAPSHYNRGVPKRTRTYREEWVFPG